VTERLTNDAVVDRALATLRTTRVRDGEVFLREARSTSIEVNDGAVENVIERGERGVGVRVLEDGRVGFAFTSDLTPAGVDECVRLARANVRVTTPDDAIAIVAESPSADGALGIHEPGLDERSVVDKMTVAFAIEAAARMADPRVKTFRKTSYGDGELATHFATTGGARGSYRETSFGAGTSCMAVDDGDRQMGYFFDAARSFERIDAAEIGAEAARRAAEKLKPRPFPTQTTDLILEPYMAMGLLGAMAALFSAENVLKGKSLLRGRIGQRVASDVVTIRDEGRLRGGMRTAPFDGEGVPTGEVTLVESGMLRGYLHSMKTARKMGGRSTGSARRGGYAGTPHVGTSNFSIAPGPIPVRELWRSTERALYITSLLNLHTIDPISGDFSLGAAATYVERGERLYAVSEIAIAGNLIDLLTKIAAVGDDLRHGPSGIGSPTLLVRDVSVGGR
jgi:PmbA protein